MLRIPGELEEAVKRHGKQGSRIESLISSLDKFLVLLDIVSFANPPNGCHMSASVKRACHLNAKASGTNETSAAS